MCRNIYAVGTAVKQTTDGECEERQYNNGNLDGEATVIFPDSSKEIRNYQVCSQRVENSLIGAIDKLSNHSFDDFVCSNKHLLTFFNCRTIS